MPGESAFSGFGAVDAEQSGRVSLQPSRIDGLAAVQTVAEFATIDSQQGGFNLAQGLSPALACLPGDGLILQGVHAGQAADTRLVELDDAFGLAARFLGLQKIVSTALQPCTKCIQGLLGDRHLCRPQEIPAFFSIGPGQNYSARDCNYFVWPAFILMK